MSNRLLIRWRQIFALRPEWEMALYQAISNLEGNPAVGVVDATSQESVHLSILAYPASAHSDVVDNMLLAAAAPLMSAQRVAVVACEPSDPEVTREQLDAELARQILGPGERHSCRALAVEDFHGDATSWLEVTLTRARLSRGTTGTSYATESIDLTAIEDNSWYL